MDNKRAEYIDSINRIVIKVGTSTLTHENGRLNISSIESIVRQIADLINRGKEVILVTSGAIGAGIGRLGLKTKPKTIPEKQAAAAVGQGILMHIYEKLFAEYGQIVAQVLLTREDMSHRIRFLNARNTLFALLDNNVIPIINENDAIVTEEIKFGDNDTLSACVASLVEADLLILLSDIDGFYDSDPHINPNAKLISWIDKITPEIEAAAGGAGSHLGTGGMATKIKAAKIAVSAGTSMVIANGSNPKIITDIITGKNIGTWFKPKEKPLHARQRWIAYSTKIKGKIYVDDGAEKAIIVNKKSLLPSGITKISGKFSEGQVVSILNSKDKEIAKGIVNYSSNEIEQIKGLNSSQIENILGHKNYDEVIHKDNMVILSL
ncbi:glutamate 5-kinase [Caloramator sp. E03]|uniref:glutamate 5-kinase n=1 Tax=Caloramator sp. E03 TaxID=2576307 RepID=UPI0011102F0B|nr:glutamate 5-kinase [Caloramator sp. E03]QCX34448.1 glutamate 5-kinase [Caloramator sp. E03]